MRNDTFDIPDLNPESKAKRFMDLMVPNQKRIFAYILLMVANHADAEDLLQETMAIMWEKFDDYEAGTDFAAWGVTIARYRIYNFRKKRKPYLTDDVMEALRSEADKVVHNIDERFGILRRCISKLSKREKRLLKMRYELDLAFEKIASRLDLSTSGVYRAISRIHVKLIECLRATRAQEEVV